MEKIIEQPFEFLGHQVTKVNCRFIQTDSQNQDVLTCDLFGCENDTEFIIYTDKAYVLGEQPFELTDEEIEALRK
jgi:hypothetical protein